MADTAGSARRTGGRKLKFYKLAGLVFAVIVILIAAASLFGGDRQYSDGEMRALQTFPKITIDGFLSGQTGQEISAYASDQLAGRDSWIGLRTFVSQFFGQSVTAGVYRGTGGYLLPAVKEPYRGNFRKSEEISGDNREVLGDIALLKDLCRVADLRDIPVPGRFCRVHDTIQVVNIPGPG